MRLTKFGHACVRIESGATALVIDPGSWSEVEAVDVATVVLITHEHADHLSFDPRHDRAVFTIDAVAKQFSAQAPDVAERVTVVSPGQVFDAGLPVRAVGELHAVIHPDLPRFYNSGYLGAEPEPAGGRLAVPVHVDGNDAQTRDRDVVRIHVDGNDAARRTRAAVRAGAPGADISLA